MKYFYRNRNLPFRSIHLMLWLSLVLSQVSVRAQDITTGLVLHLPFDNSVADASGNNNTPTASTAFFAADRYNRSYQSVVFGGYEYVQFPFNSAATSNFNITDYTLALWINTSSATNQWIWVKGTNNVRYQMNVTPTGQLMVTYLGAVNENVVSSPGYNDGQWHFVVYRRSGSTTTIFVDNVADTTVTGVITSNNTTNDVTSIGKFPNSAAYPFMGKMDEIRFYNRALSDQDIDAIYNLPAPQLPSNPVSQGMFLKYDFNGNATDESGNNHNGTIAGPVLTTDRFSIPNRAYSFGGKITTNFGFPSSTELSVSAWFLSTYGLNANTSTDVIWEKDGHYTLFYHQGYFYLNHPAGTASLPSTFAPNTWHHIVITLRQTGQIEWFVDNVQTHGAYYTTTVPTAASILAIGNSPTVPQNGWSGKLDDIRFYSRTLRVDEVDSLYSQVKINQPPYKASATEMFNINEDAGQVTLCDLDTMYRDVELGAMTFAVMNASANVAVSKDANNLLKVLTDANYFGNDSLFVQYSDGATTMYDTLYLNVASINDAPSFDLETDTLSIPFDFTTSQNVLTSLHPDNESEQTVTYSMSPASVDFATISFDNVTGQFSVANLNNLSGKAVITITANDGQPNNNIASKSFLLDVQGINLDTALLSYYPFTNGSFSNSKGQNTLGGQPVASSDRFGVRNSAINFNSNKKLTGNVSFANFGISNEFSMSFWMNPATALGANTGLCVIAEYLYGFVLKYQGGVLTLSIANEANQTANYSITRSFNANTWYHVVVNVDKSTGKVIFYIDGVATVAGNIPVGILNVASQTFYLGGGTYYFFPGLLDEVRLHDRALNGVERNFLLNQTKAPLQVIGSLNPIVLDEDQATTAIAELNTLFQEPDGVNLVYTFTNSPSITIANTNGTVTAMPATNYHGVSPFEIAATNGRDTVKVNTDITVQAVNDAPSFTLSPNSFVLPQNFADTLVHYISTQPVDELANDQVTYTVTNSGSLVNFSVDAANNQIIMSSIQSMSGNETFTVTATDQGGLTYEQTFTVQVQGAIYDGLIASYHFQGNANNTNPLSVGQFNGTVTAAVLRPDRQNRRDSAYYFDGNGDYITVADNDALDFGTSTDFSILLWFRAPKSATLRVLFDKGDYPRYYATLTQSGQIQFMLAYPSGAGYDELVTNIAGGFDDDMWHHVSFTANRDGNMNIYVDGQLIASKAITIPGTLNSAMGLRFGCFSNVLNSYFNGYIDDIYIYNREITPNEASMFSNIDRPTFLKVLSIHPANNSRLSWADTLGIVFNQPIDSANAGIRLYGSQSGLHSPNLKAMGDTLLIINNRDFAVGEDVHLSILKTFHAVSGDTLITPSFTKYGVKSEPAHEKPAAIKEAGIVDNQVIGAYSVDAGDVDGDGDIDAVGLSSGEGKITIYTNDGTGAFTQTDISQSYTSGVDVKFADMNNDGRLDVIASTATTLAWFANNGNGTFASAVSIVNTGASIIGAIKTADMDNDGDLDIITHGSANTSGIGVMYKNNNNATSFSAAITVGAGNGYTTLGSLSVGDLNQDMKNDVLSTTLSSIEVRQANANYTTYTATAFYSYPYNGNYYEGYGFATDIADMDGDGDNDVVMASLGASNATSKVHWRENLGNGTFANPTQIASFGLNKNTATISTKAADLDGDGDNDVVVLANDEKLVWIENLRNGNYSSVRTIATLAPLNSRLNRISVSDFNGDGRADVLAAAGGSFRYYSSADLATITHISPNRNDINAPLDANITVEFDHSIDTTLINSSTVAVFGSLSGKKMGQFAFSPDSKGFAFNPDNNFFAGEKVTVSINNLADTSGSAIANGGVYNFTTAAGNISGFYEVAAIPNNAGGKKVLTGDFDGDHNIDFVAYAKFFQQLKFDVHQNLTGFDFAQKAIPNFNLAFAYTPTILSTTDYNNDGLLEMLSTQDDGRIYANTMVNGTVSQYFSLNAAFYVGGSVLGLDNTDIDQNGQLDLLVSTSRGQYQNVATLAYYPNNNGTYTGVNLEMNNDTRMVRGADLNNDNNADIIYINSANSLEVRYMNKGTVIASRTVAASVTNVTGMEFADINGDRLPDLIVTRTVAPSIAVYMNNNGVLGAAQQLTTSAAAVYQCQIFDADNDGDNDIIADNGAMIEIYKNEGNSSISAATTLATTNSLVHQFLFADFDNDADLDLLVANDNGFYVYSNGIPPNNAPQVVNPLQDVTMTEGDAPRVLTSSVNDHFTDADGQALTLSVATSNQDVTASISGKDLIVSPVTDFSGQVYVYFSANDGYETTTDTIMVMVSPVNDAPSFMFINNALTVSEDAYNTQNITIVITQPANETESISFSVEPTINYAIVSIVNDTLRIEPIADMFGIDTLTITANDGELTYSQEFILNVEPVNDAPAIAPISDITVDEDFDAIAVAVLLTHPQNEGQALTFTLTPETVDFAQVNFDSNTGSLGFSPIANAFGSQTFTFAVYDESGAGSTQTFTLTVNPVNDEPVFQLSSNLVYTSKNFADTIKVTANSLSPANEVETITYSVSPNPANVTFANMMFDEITGQVSFTSLSDQLGSVTIGITANDGSLSYQQFFEFHVVNNQPPTVVTPFDNVTLNEDFATTSLASSVSMHFSDFENDPMTFIVTTDNQSVNVFISNDTLYASSTADFFGTVVVTVAANDGNANGIATFNINVTPVNDEPTFTLSANELLLDEDFARTGLLITSTQPANETEVVTYTLETPSTLANISFEGDSIIVKSMFNAFGSEVLTVIANDGEFTTAQQFTLTINSVDDAPMLMPIGDITTNEDSGDSFAVPMGVMHPQNEGQTLTFMLSPQSVDFAHIQFNSNTGDLGIFADVPDGYGSQLFTVTVTDNAGQMKLQNSQTFTLTVNPENDAPVFQLSSNVVYTSKNFADTIKVTANSLSPANEVETITYSVSPNPANVTFANMMFDEITGQVSFTSIADEVGSVTVHVTANDGSLSYQQSFEFHVVNNQPPTVATPFDNVTLNEDFATTTLASSVSAHFSDLENDPMTFSVVTDNQSVNVFISNDTLYASSTADFFGTVVVTVSANDGTTSGNTTFAINVTPVNDAPTFTLSANELMLEEDFARTGLFITSTQPANENDVITYSLETPSTLANISFEGDSIIVKSMFNAFGSEVLTVIANDGELTAAQQFTLTINNVDDAPMLMPIADVMTNEDSGDSFAVPMGIMHPQNEGQTLMFTLSPQSVDFANIQFDSNTGNISIFADVPDGYGSQLFTVTVIDNAGQMKLQASQTFTLTVNPENDVPMFELSQNKVVTGKNFADTIKVDAISHSPANETETIMYSISPNPANITFANVMFNELTGNVAITSVADAVGTATIAITANDGSLQYNQSFELHVLSNQPPVVVTPFGNVQVNEDFGSMVVDNNVSSHFTDAEGDALMIGASSNNADITVELVNNQLSIAAPANYFGSAQITVSVSDANSTIQTTFDVDVTPVNDAPDFDLSRTNVELMQDFAGVETITVIPVNRPANEIENVTYNVFDMSGAKAGLVNVLINQQTGEVSITSVAGMFGSATFMVRADDGQSVNNTVSRTFTVIVNRANTIPTSISLSNNSINENQPTASVVGTLSATDNEDVNFTFFLVSGTGDADNSSFEITGNTLIAATSFNFEQRNSYNIRVRVDDGFGGMLDSAMVISINNTNDLPFNLAISHDTISEIRPAGTFVATISATDEDANTNFVYALATGNGTDDADNSKFQVSGNELKTAVELDFETKNQHNIFLSANDQQGGTVAAGFVIKVNDVNPTSAPSVERVLDCNIYPNPTQGGIYVDARWKTSQRFTIELVDMTGRKVFQTEVEAQHWQQYIELSGVEVGVYTLRLVSNEHVFTHSVVKQ